MITSVEDSTQALKPDTKVVSLFKGNSLCLQELPGMEVGCLDNS